MMLFVNKKYLNDIKSETERLSNKSKIENIIFFKKIFKILNNIYN